MAKRLIPQQISSPLWIHATLCSREPIFVIRHIAYNLIFCD